MKKTIKLFVATFAAVVLGAFAQAAESVARPNATVQKLSAMTLTAAEHKYNGWMLWAVQLFSAVTVALISGQDTSPSPVIHSPATTLAQAMKKATQAMASVCGWVVLFRILTGHLGRLSMADGLYILPNSLIHII